MDQVQILQLYNLDMYYGIITTNVPRTQSRDSHGIVFGSTKAFLQFY